MCDDYLMYAERVVIPDAFQNQILRLYRVGYPEISRIKAPMGSYVF